MDALERRLSYLDSRGVVLVDRRQVFVDEAVQLDRICPTSVLFPGTRLHGGRTLVGRGAQVGAQGPTTLIDAVLDSDVVVDSGVVEGAVLLQGARLGPNAHVRPGTLVEEQASTAHAVGLKHTILLAYVTLGSLINFCDALIAGGTSRKDHSEVGSGYIHFNYTPWGAHGDKATPSLIGDVVSGVFLRSPRIFLGGSGGMVGPRRVGFGAVAAAGQVLREDVGKQRMFAGTGPRIDRDLRPGRVDPVQPRLQRNLEYVGQLAALRAWYQHVRLARLPGAPEFDPRRACILAAIENIDLALEERCSRIRAFLDERGAAMPNLDLSPAVSCPWPRLGSGPSSEHLQWVQSLPEADVQAGQRWLGEVAARIRSAEDMDADVQQGNTTGPISEPTES